MSKKMICICCVFFVLFLLPFPSSEAKGAKVSVENSVAATTTKQQMFKFVEVDQNAFVSKVHTRGLRVRVEKHNGLSAYLKKSSWPSNIPI